MKVPKHRFQLSLAATCVGSLLIIGDADAQEELTDEALGVGAEVAEQYGASRAAGGLRRAGNVATIGSALNNASQGDFPAVVGDLVGGLVGVVSIPGGALAGSVIAPGPGTIAGAAAGAAYSIQAGNQAEQFARGIIDFFVDDRPPLRRRADSVGLDFAEFADRTSGDLRQPGALAQYEADLRREILRREAEAAAESGRSFIPDADFVAQIQSFELIAEQQRQETAQVLQRATAPESQLNSSLAGMTTGLASHIGDAREPRSPDPELERVLSTAVDGPFVTSVETPSGVATGQFAGTEGLNVAGILNVLAFDSGALQDGDRVRLTIRDSRGVVLSRSITLTFGGTRSQVLAQRGLVNVTIRALNEGSAPPNTGGLRVSGEIAGSRSRNFNLSAGQSGTLVVRVLGN